MFVNTVKQWFRLCLYAGYASILDSYTVDSAVDFSCLQGDIFREYSRKSTATTHYFPWKFSRKLNKNPVIFREYSLKSTSTTHYFPWKISRNDRAATCRIWFRLQVPKTNPEPWTLILTLTLTLNPNPNPRTHRNPNPNFNRNRNKVFERKRRTEYDTEIKVNKELYL